MMAYMLIKMLDISKVFIYVSWTLFWNFVSKKSA